MPLADGSVDKPAKVTRSEFPRRAVVPQMPRTLPDVPARRGGILGSAISRDQEKHLPFNMRRYVSPSLLVAVYGFDGRSEQLRHLTLCFVQLFPEKDKLILLQVNILSSV